MVLLSLIVFMIPSISKQQIDACHNMMSTDNFVIVIITLMRVYTAHIRFHIFLCYRQHPSYPTFGFIHDLFVNWSFICISKLNESFK